MTILCICLTGLLLLGLGQEICAKGENRDTAIENQLQALRGFNIEGVKTTIPAHLALLDSQEFRSGNYDTGTVPRVLSALSEEGGK